jgi:transcriptional regulator with XRE-family HTH domain/Tfp pilus assembly protein PilF
LNIGRRIAKIRRVKNIPQESICKGVVSRSHLSNIESGRYEPAEDILHILADRLGVPNDYLLKSDEVDEDLEQLLASLRKQLNVDVVKAEEILHQIKDKYPFIHSVYQEAYFFLLESCYYIKKRDSKTSKNILENEFLPLINENRIDAIPTQLREPYYYIRGVLSYYQQDYLQCYQYYLQQLQLVDSNIQKAAIYFNISLTLWKLHDIINAISYAHKARTLYFDEHQWYKAADAYNSLGILYWENNELNHAENQLMKALDMAEQYKYHELKGRIYHNLGLVYMDRQAFPQCLDYFKQSLKLKKKIKHPSINMTYRSILNIYIEQNLVDEAKIILKEAQASCVDEVEINHLRVIEANLNLILGQRNVFESTMKDCINFFNSNRYWKHITLFSEDLADYYQRSRKYKQASEYYKMSIKAYKKLNGSDKVEKN